MQPFFVQFHLFQKRDKQSHLYTKFPSFSLAKRMHSLLHISTPQCNRSYSPPSRYPHYMSAYVCVKIVVLHFALFRVFSVYSQFPATVQTIVSIYCCRLFEYGLIWLPCGFCKIEQHCAYTEPLTSDRAQ